MRAMNCCISWECRLKRISIGQVVLAIIIDRIYKQKFLELINVDDGTGK